MDGLSLVQSSYEGVVLVAADLTEEESWAQTGCLGWSVRDLLFHCTMDAQRALVALHTPVDREPDTDAVSYWRGWGDDPAADADGRRFGRVQASMFREWTQLRDWHAETAHAAVEAARRADPHQVVATQGHALLVDDLLRTLAVEATVHHLDLVAHVPSASGPADLGETRRVLDHLGATPFPTGWHDRDVVLVGTGRRPPTNRERLELGPLAGELPLFS